MPEGFSRELINASELTILQQLHILPLSRDVNSPIPPVTTTQVCLRYEEPSITPVSLVFDR